MLIPESFGVFHGLMMMHFSPQRLEKNRNRLRFGMEFQAVIKLGSFTVNYQRRIQVPQLFVSSPISIKVTMLSLSVWKLEIS